MQLNCLRYLGINSFLEINRMTVDEYKTRMNAFNLKHLDEEYRLHKLAWKFSQVQATDKKGKPLFKNFSDFFDYKKMEQKILGTRPQDRVLKDKSLNDMLLKSNK